MCGISGAVIFNPKGDDLKRMIADSVQCLASRGPDATGFYEAENLVLGHRRLSIIDTSDSGNQPLSDPSERYTIIFNGEFFNYREHRKALEDEGIVFKSSTDTEVVLQLYIRHGEACLKMINGFFALAIYDNELETVFIARDRFGVKPLYYHSDPDKICFGSEIRSVLAFGVAKNADPATLRLYLQLNYVPGPWSMYASIRQLEPGHAMLIQKKNHTTSLYRWYRLSIPQTLESDYRTACRELYKRMEASVERRLVSDVPLGAFLSGGIDSSIVVALAAQKVKGLHTFSIGFSNEPAFDETAYAAEVAAHCGTSHRAFSLTADDLLDVLPAVLDYPGEPFADSSALAVYILSRETRKYVTVALSGDGGDELFAGYRKHRAEWMIRHNRLAGVFSRSVSPLLQLVKGSRQTATGNRIRQFHRFAEGASMSTEERYWRWCSMSTKEQVKAILTNGDAYTKTEANERITKLTSTAARARDLNQILLNDVEMVLPFDMLTKVDLMSMANSLEVRVPFLDYTVAEYAFSLPEKFKIDKDRQKKILKDTFGDLLPPTVFNRKKQGFEVPLTNWFRTTLKPMLDEYLDPGFLKKQKIFNPAAVQQLRNDLNTSNSGDATARIWALIAYQRWWFNNNKR